MYYPYSENKGAGQLRGYREADLRLCFRICKKPVFSRRSSFMKLRSSCTPLMTDIRIECPEMQHLFLYRNCKDTVSSFAATLKSDPYGVMLMHFSDCELLSTFLPIFKRMLRLHIASGKRGSPEVPLNVNTVGLLTYLWAEQIKLTQDAMSLDRRIHVLPIKYEDIEIDLMHLGRAVSSLSRDSHRGTIMSQSQKKQKMKLAFADRVMLTLF